MKLSISNIAWEESYDKEVYNYLKEVGFTGLEIAPTKVFKEEPYRHKTDALLWANELYVNYGLHISSIQSILHGRNENIFSSEKERAFLISYMKNIIDFASLMNCHNIVFGCPKNRVLKNDNDLVYAINFFKELSHYAGLKNTCISIEPNPSIYGTNFINTTSQAIAFIKEIDSPFFKLNLDTGTILKNEEDLAIVENYINLINHIHISEPFLTPIKNRGLHKELNSILIHTNYTKYISIEMKQTDTNKLYGVIDYVRTTFKI